MLASYVLSFTIVPAMARQMLKDEQHHGESERIGFGRRLTNAFDRAFDHFRNAYGTLLAAVLVRRKFVLSCFAVFFATTGALMPVVGTDFFPTADVGILKLHVRAPKGYRLEGTEGIMIKAEDRIREIIPPAELRTVNHTIGVPGALNLAFVPSDNVSGADGEMLISLNKPHRPSDYYRRLLRERLEHDFPGVTFYFQTADIVSQVLNFGLPAPIDIQIQDQNFARSYEVGQRLLQMIRRIPGVVDPRITQILDFPTLQIDVDRQRAARLGVAQRDVANNMLASLSGSSLISPTYYLNPQNGVNYTVAVVTPVDRLQSVGDILNFPANPPTNNINPVIQQALPTTLPSAPVTRLSDIASVRPGSTMNSINHYTIQRVIDVAANVEGRDLGSVATEINQAIAEVQKDLPSTTKILLRGQNEVMENSFRMLGFGLILAVVLVYAVLVILFQSWVDPFIIMMAVPAALLGIVWTLVLTGTTINVMSLMGAIMAVGISVSNSILVVSFANDLRARDEKLTPFEAVIASGKTRLRPVLMTALAMIMGMVPMALGLGDAGEQNAPLGRAVIGGLVFATFATLLLVPIFYTLLRKNAPALHTLDQRFAAEATGASKEALGHG
jgi:multidrug efflux pump subunit AcrB